VSTEDRTAVIPGAGASDRPRTRTQQVSRRDRLRRLLLPRHRIYQLLLLAALLGAWEYAGRKSPSFALAPPSSVIPAARDMIGSGQLQDAAGDSLVALLLGFALAAVVGMAIGYAMGWWTAVGRTLDPFVTAMYVVPIASLVPLIIVWAGLGLGARVIVIFLFALFEVLLNAYAGVKNADPTFVDVARTFGAKRRDVLRKVLIPASLPFLFTGLRMGAIRGVKGMVLAEMLFAVTGLGGLIITNAGLFRMDKVLVVIVTIALIGMVMSGLVQLAERYVMRWRADPRGA
jgi:ABC-type nitrate/sulfonate/bicarbonate transport system permease component